MTVLAKICGLSTEETLAAAVDGGASHVGFVHYPPSSRHLTLERLAKRRRWVPSSVGTVAVLVAPDNGLLDQLAPLSLDVLQLHEVTPGRAAEVRARWTGELWVGVPVRSAAELAAADAYAPHVDRLLLDAPTGEGEVPGGTGRSFDWGLLRDAAPATPWILSGGLDPDNVADAIAHTGADFVDVSSGVESGPGVKDVDKITAFLTACRR